MSRVNFDPRDRAYRRPERRMVGKKWITEVEGDGGKVRLLARSGGYVMVRRQRCMPFVLTEKQWAAMPLFSEQTYD